MSEQDTGKKKPSTLKYIFEATPLLVIPLIVIAVWNLRGYEDFTLLYTQGMMAGDGLDVSHALVILVISFPCFLIEASRWSKFENAAISNLLLSIVLFAVVWLLFLTQSSFQTLGMAVIVAFQTPDGLIAVVNTIRTARRNFDGVRG